VVGAQRPIAAVISQGISSLTSLLLALVAARELGAEGLGEFAILFSILITFNSLATGYVGDSLTVLDRFDPELRRAIGRAAVAVCVLGTVVAIASALLMDAGWAVASAFALALLTWVIEEFGRRLLITRLEFWKLALNDMSFLAVTAAVIVALLAADRLTLVTLLLAMGTGSLAALVLAVVQLPRRELAPARSGSAALRRLNRFAAWRAAQTAVRPLSMSTIRISVALVATTAAVGDLEGARILATPMTTLIAGAATFLLPKMAAEERGEDPRRLPVTKVALWLGGVSLVVGIGCTLLVPWIAVPLLGEGVQVDQLAALFWAIFAAAFGLGIPFGNALVAMQQARLTFWIRVADAAVGVVGATVLAWLVSPSWAPLGLAMGALIGASWCFGSLRRRGRV
jgi:O-antigen/teichoic acid export membrane protein